MKIVYQGYYGAKNSGDDAFVEVSSWGASKYWNCDEHLFFAAELPKIKTSASYFAPHESYLNFSKAIYNIMKSDIYVSAGGSTFHSSLKKTDLRMYAKLKKQLGVKGKIGAIGVSLGPFGTIQAENNTIEYLKRLDFLALRDAYSYNLACSYDLPYQPIEAFDLAALLPDIYPNTSQISEVDGTKILGISACNYESYIGGDKNKETLRNRFIENVLMHFKDDPSVKLRFFIFNGNSQLGDKQITEQIIENLSLNDGQTNFEIVPYLANVEETFNKVRECSVMLSTRLHASIFACFAKVPFFLLEYHRKCTNFLDDVGQPLEYKVYDGDSDVRETITQIEDILYNNIYKVPLYVEQVKGKALKNFTEASHLIKK